MREDHHSAGGADRSTPLEDLLADAIAARESGGPAAVDAFLAAHPADAAGLREALSDLDVLDRLPRPRDDLPRRLGEFALREPLGAGGMGIVYVAEQTSLGREVALKVVRPELLFFDGARERFRREIDAVARLEHPAIVPILASGTADGVPWYAMPRLRGRSAEAVCRALAGREPSTLTGADLHALLDTETVAAAAVAAGTGSGTGTGDTVFAGPWWRTVVRLVHQAALGIEHAHARGVLHRDLKPSNLMLTTDGRAVVLDFGLAIARGDARLTRTGVAAGSPAFMAPEQVRGEAADERTDVYGLAATLHCLLALRAPFDAANAEGLKSQILAGARRSLPHTAVPAEVRLVLACAMDVEPARRYRSAHAFADDLQALLDGRPIAARGLPATVRLRRFARRNRALTTGLAAAALFVLVLPSLLLVQQRGANERLARSANTAIDAVEHMLAAVARERMLYVAGGADVAAEMLHRAVALFDDVAADATQSERAAELRIRTLQRLADVEKARGRFDEALAAARRAATSCGAGELAGEARLRRGEATRVLAGLLIDRGLVDEADALVDASRRDLEPLTSVPALRTRAEINLAALHGHRAMLASRGGDLAGHELGLRDAILCYADAGERLCVASEQAKLAGVLIARGQHTAAMALADAALANVAHPDVRADGWPTPRHVEAVARMARGRALQVLDRVDDAIVEQQRALALFDAFLRDFPNEPSARRARGVTSHSLALVRIDQRRWRDARLLLERACDDQQLVLSRLPDATGARDDLARHALELARCLVQLRDFVALAPLARRIGAMPGDATLPLSGAHGLLCCAAAAATEPERAALREEALVLWLESARRGRPLDFAEPVFAPLHDDPRVAALRPR